MKKFVFQHKDVTSRQEAEIMISTYATFIAEVLRMHSETARVVVRSMAKMDHPKVDIKLIENLLDDIIAIDEKIAGLN